MLDQRYRVGLVVGPEAQIVLDRAHARDRTRYDCDLQAPRAGWNVPGQTHDAVPHLQANVFELMVVESLPDLALELTSQVFGHPARRIEFLEELVLPLQVSQ